MSFEEDNEWVVDDMPQDNGALDVKVQIENMFYEAEGLSNSSSLGVMDKNPDEALSLFQTVIEMEEQEDECNL